MSVKVLTLDLAWVSGGSLEEERERLRRGECLAVWDLENGVLYVMEGGKEEAVPHKPRRVEN